MDLFSFLLGASKGGGGSSSSIDWSLIGYSKTPQGIIDAYNYAKDVSDNWNSSDTNLLGKFSEDLKMEIMPLVDTSNAVTMQNMFQYCYGLNSIPLLNTSKVNNMNNMFQYCYILKTVPQFDTSKVTNMATMFYYCRSLENVPQFDTSKVTNVQNMFRYCPKLTDESLDNILKMCINMNPSYAGLKTLKQMGIESANDYPQNRIQALPSYNDFINAGWTLGY